MVNQVRDRSPVLKGMDSLALFGNSFFQYLCCLHQLDMSKVISKSRYWHKLSYTNSHTGFSVKSKQFFDCTVGGETQSLSCSHRLELFGQHIFYLALPDVTSSSTAHVLNTSAAILHRNGVHSLLLVGLHSCLLAQVRRQRSNILSRCTTGVYCRMIHYATHTHGSLCAWWSYPRLLLLLLSLLRLWYLTLWSLNLIHTRHRCSRCTISCSCIKLTRIIYFRRLFATKTISRRCHGWVHTGVPIPPLKLHTLIQRMSCLCFHSTITRIVCCIHTRHSSRRLCLLKGWRI
mmetsp:Transcript_28466/g.40068  ORF Transcript_28466/g.40068 Transcript_28466/m.40068 type:complete len:289 (+) Transcript_28466:370-1236(+)